MRGYFKNLKNSGFTIIEMLVVISIAVILTVSMFSFSKAVERQLILFQEQQKIVNALTEAKSLSLELFTATSSKNLLPPCAYGVHFDQNSNQVIVFEDYPIINRDDSNIACSSKKQMTNFSDNMYFSEGSVPTTAPNSTSTDIAFLTMTLDSRVKIINLGFKDIVFIAPNPDIIIDNDVNKNSAIIDIQTIDGLATRTIKVMNSGQITTQ